METISQDRIIAILKNYGITTQSEDARVIIDFIDKINKLSQSLGEYILLQKPVLNFDETCRYLDVNSSHL